MTDSPATGWYPDPNGPPGQERWWDSSRAAWSEHVRLATAPVARSSTLDAWALVAAVGCVAMLIGPFAPWASALGGIVSRSGVDVGGEDAWAMLALAVGSTLIIFQWLTTGKTRDFTLLLTALAVAGIAVFHIVDFANHDGIAIGWGLYLSAFGAATVALTSFLGLVNSR